MARYFWACGFDKSILAPGDILTYPSVCPVCGEPFYRSTGRSGQPRTYCSPKCRQKARPKRPSPPRPMVAFTCQRCGETFERKYRANANPTFCSDRCRSAAARADGSKVDKPRPGQHLTRYPERVCEVCGLVYRPTYEAQRTCGRRCGHLVKSAE